MTSRAPTFALVIVLTASRALVAVSTQSHVPLSSSALVRSTSPAVIFSMPTARDSVSRFSCANSSRTRFLRAMTAARPSLAEAFDGSNSGFVTWRVAAKARRAAIGPCAGEGRGRSQSRRVARDVYMTSVFSAKRSRGSGRCATTRDGIITTEGKP